MNKLTQLAKSEKGKELIDKAQAMANDPKNREKLETARGKVEEQIAGAKQKLADKRGEKDGTSTTPTTEPTATGTPAYGEPTPAGTTPTYGEEDTTEQGVTQQPTATGTPAYGEDTPAGTEPTYGEDGPKAA